MTNIEIIFRIAKVYQSHSEVQDIARDLGLEIVYRFGTMAYFW